MWQALLSSILGGAMNKKNPEIADVNYGGDKVLGGASKIQSNDNGNTGGFMSALSGLADGKEGETANNGWKLDPKTNMWSRG